MPAAGSHGLSLVLLRPLGHVIARLGHDPARYWSALGVDIETSDDAYVDAALVDRVLGAIAAEHGDPCFGLTLAQTSVQYPLGVFDYLVWSGETVRDVLTRAARFYGLLTTRARLVIEENEVDGIATITQRLASRAPRGTVLTELLFASFVLRCRQAAGSLVVRSMRFEHDVTPEAAVVHRDLFAAPVLFRQPTDTLDVDIAQLARPVGTADAVVAATLEAKALQMSASVSSRTSSFLDGVREEILRALPRQAIGLAELARGLGVSERTVQRRLGDHGTSLRDLIDATRKEVAMKRLREGAPTVHVAYELGFAHSQAFHKAFLRWTGTTPGMFRRRHVR